MVEDAADDGNERESWTAHRRRCEDAERGQRRRKPLAHRARRLPDATSSTPDAGRHLCAGWLAGRRLTLQATNAVSSVRSVINELLQRL